MKARDIVGIGILLAWVGVMVAVQRDAQGPTLAGPMPEALVGDSAILPSDDWLGAFMKGKRIGYVHIQRTVETEGYRLREESVLNLRVMNTVQKVVTNAKAEVGKDYGLRRFDFALDASGSHIEVSGEVQRRGEQYVLALTIVTAGEPSTRELVLDEPPNFDLNLVPAVMQRRPKAGTVYEMPVFDPQSMQNRKVRVEVVGYEDLEAAGRTWYACHLRQSFASIEGVTMDVWADESGKLLKMQTPLGMSFLKERQSEGRLHAMRGIETAAELGEDLLRQVSVLPDGEVANPKERDELRVRLGGISLEGLDLNDGAQGRQRLEGEVLVVQRGGHSPAGEALERSALAAEALVQSDHADIQAQAQALVDALPVEDRAARGRKIFDWVFETLEKRNVVGVPSALEVLRNKVGDCNEHTALFVALCRAAGIPARTNVGVVFQEGRFFYHAWPELQLPEGWLPVDPTWGQWPADATHLRFLRGGLEKQVELMRIMGRLTLKVEEGA